MLNYDMYEPDVWELAEQEDERTIEKYGSMDNYYNRIYDEQDNENIMKGDEIKIKAIIR